MFGTIKAKYAVVWVNHDRKLVYVMNTSEMESWWPPNDEWGDPIGRSYMNWRTASTNLRMTLMQDTVIELAARGFNVADVLIEFAKVKEFFDLGRKSYPMCRALTTALMGTTREANIGGLCFSDTTFEELFRKYRSDVKKRVANHDRRLSATFRRKAA